MLIRTRRETYDCHTYATSTFCAQRPVTDVLRCSALKSKEGLSPAPKRTKSLARFSPQPLNPGVSAPQSSPSTRRVNILPQRWCAEYPSDEESNWCTLWFCSHAVGRSRSIELSLAGKSNEVKSCSNDAMHAREHEQKGGRCPGARPRHGQGTIYNYSGQ